MFDTLPAQLFLAIIFGAVIGLERESKAGDDLPGSAGGIRTFALTCLLGALAGAVYATHLPVFVLIAAVFSLLLVSYYIIGSLQTKYTGLTNEISIIYTFVIGFFLTTRILPLQLLVALFVVVVLILAFKEQSKRIMSGISRREIESFISYAIVALVVLPFLPNTGYTVAQIPYLPAFLSGYGVSLGDFAALEIINPRKIWFIVVLVTGIDVFGYLLGKFIGHKKSVTVTSFVAGFVSSTSTTQALAQKSRRVKTAHYLVGAAMLANLASFFQIFLLVGPLNPLWLVAITPTVFILLLSSGALSMFFLYHRDSARDDDVVETKEKKIFSLIPAVKFALLLIAVKIITKTCLILFGESGFVISSVIASLAGIDAIVLNLADMAGRAITFQFALFTLLLVNATNLLSKAVYSFLQGSRQFAARFLVSVIAVIAVSFSGLLFAL